MHLILAEPLRGKVWPSVSSKTLFSRLYFLYHPGGPAESRAAVVPCEIPPASQPANRDRARSSALPGRSSHVWDASCGSVNLAGFSGRVTSEIRVCLFFYQEFVKDVIYILGSLWKKGKLAFWMYLYLFLHIYKITHTHYFSYMC